MTKPKVAVQHKIHATSLAVLALLGCVAACHRDPEPPPGTLVIRQVGGRLGDTADDLGVLVVGQSVCGTHVALHSEGGALAVFDGERRTDVCLRLPLHGPTQALELLVYPTETAALLHGQLLIEPGTCAALPPACEELCPPDEADDDDDEPLTPFVSAACPPDARLVDQTTLLVQAVLPAPAAGTTTTGTGATTGQNTGDSETGDSTGTPTGTGTGTSTSTGTGTGTSTNP